MATITFAKHIASWDQLNRTLKPLIKDMPELTTEQQQLEDLITQAKALQTEQGGSLAKFREAVRQRQDVEQTGQDLHARISAVLRGKLGFKNNELHAFGIEPKKPRRKKGSGAPSITPPTTTPSTPAVEAAPAPHPPATSAAGPATK